MTNYTRYSYVSTAVPTTLASPLGAVSPGSTGPVVVNSVTGWPSTFPFTVVAEPGTSNAEVITITQAATGTGPFTFANSIRGDDGSSAPAHLANAVIAHGIAGRDGYRTDWINVLAQPWGADPTGNSDSTAAINNALAAAYASPWPGQPVYLPSGTYKTLSSIVIPPGGVLIGDFADEITTHVDALYGTTIQPGSAWTSTTAGTNTWYGAIQMLGGTVPTVNYAGNSEEQKILGIHVDCSNVPGGTLIDGVQMYGFVRRTWFEHVQVSYPTGNGFNYLTDTGGNGPDSPHLFRCNVRNSVLSGFNHNRISDSTYIDCLAEDCGSGGGAGTSDGWTITNASNGKFIACRSEHNGAGGVGNGFTFIARSSTTGSGGCVFSGCSTDRNEGNGYYIESTNASAAPVAFAGCNSRRDGRNSNSGGGGLAGFVVTAYPSVVQLSGCQVWPGVDDDGTGTNSPQIGMLLSGNDGTHTYISVGGATYIQGATTAISDDGSAAASAYSPEVFAATGTTSSPSVRGPRSGTATMSGGTALVLTSAVKSGSVITVTPTSASSLGTWHIATIVAGTSFAVVSSNGSDASTLTWSIANP